MLTTTPDTESTTTGDAAIVREFVEAVTASDVDRALAVCRPEIYYSVPGRGTVGGDHIGFDAVRAALSSPSRPGTRTLRLLTHAVIGGDSPVVSYHEVLAELDGEPVRYRMMLLFGFTGGLISEIHEFTDDQYVVDDLFSPAAPQPATWRDRWAARRGRR